MLPSLFTGFIAGLVVVNLGSSVLNFQALRSRAKSQEYSYHDRDYPEQWQLSREAPPVVMVAEESVHYAIDTPEALEEWATTQVDGGGFMRVGPPQRGFAVAMFHQMHCMRLMRWALGGKYDIYAWGHMQHCLSYLRQDILCAADVTLEPADILERDYENQRVGAVHVCNNWEALYSEGNDNWAEWYKKEKANSTKA